MKRMTRLEKSIPLLGQNNFVPQFEHSKEVWLGAISPDREFVVSSSLRRTVRRY